ncbi:hypothetical protein BHE74_00043344 [Ensete ventricosum]|nr:hypothetical protein BHE74_00043344 [Ensete ventricosum]
MIGPPVPWKQGGSQRLSVAKLARSTRKSLVPGFHVADCGLITQAGRLNRLYPEFWILLAVDLPRLVAVPPVLGFYKYV